MTSAEDFVRKEISRTGFPLVLEVLSLLRGKGWLTTAQDYFYDEDEEKSRYIDIATRNHPPIRDPAGKFGLEPYYPIDVNWNLSIECKKTEKKNWVFFPIPDQIELSGQSLNLAYHDFEVFISNFNHYDRKKVASIYTVFPKGKDEIFQAVMQTVKHVSYSRRKVWERIQYDEECKYDTYFWFPIIVVDGMMWNVFTEKGQITDVVESKHMLLKVQYGSGFETFNYALDIVHKSYFSTLIDLLQRGKGVHEEYLAKNKTAIMKQLDKEFNYRLYHR